MVRELSSIGGLLPTEFRIWHAGSNSTANGYSVNFTEAAAAAVMADYQRHGVELMIDLEHLSLDPESRSYDPSARGWCALEVRRDANGGPELWAVNVRWTEDGARRLTNREARYISPAFILDEQGEPTSVLNIALVAMPGTDGILPLVASRAQPRRKTNMVRLSRLGAALAALKTLSAEEVSTLAAAEGDMQEVAGTNIAELAAFLGVDVDPAQDPAGFVAALKAKLQEVVSKLDGAAAPASEDAPPGPEMAAASRLLALTETRTLSDAVDTVVTLRAKLAQHDEAVRQLQRESAALKQAKQHALVVRLVKCGAELPGTAWQDPTAAQLMPKPWLLAMSLEELEARVLAFEASAPRRAERDTPVTLPELSERERKMLSAIADPQERERRTAHYLTLKSNRKAG